VIVDVRTVEEFRMGAVPGAVSIPLDELQQRASELGETGREITLYCASGARSAYGQRLLQQMGYSRVRNGGGLHDMMARV
jgi:rhodanese-related sulfurtransferase